MGEPLVPDRAMAPDGPSARAGIAGGSGGSSPRIGTAPWTRFAAVAELPPAERGLVVCGDGDYDPAPLLSLAEQASWPVLAEPSSNARRGPCALGAYQYLLADPGFVAVHQPDVVVSAGRPGLSRGQLGLLRSASIGRHVVIAQGPGPWADPARSATDVAGGGRPAGPPPRPPPRPGAPWLWGGPGRGPAAGAAGGAGPCPAGRFRGPRRGRGPAAAPARAAPPRGPA